MPLPRRLANHQLAASTDSSVWTESRCQTLEKLSELKGADQGLLPRSDKDRPLIYLYYRPHRSPTPHVASASHRRSTLLYSILYPYPSPCPWRMYSTLLYHPRPSLPLSLRNQLARTIPYLIRTTDPPTTPVAAYTLKPLVVVYPSSTPDSTCPPSLLLIPSSRKTKHHTTLHPISQIHHRPQTGPRDPRTDPRSGRQWRWTTVSRLG